MDELFIICSCYSLEHQLLFNKWKDDDTGLDVISVDVHLYTYDNFWKRLWHGLKYAFGYKSRYGAWDSFIFQEKDVVRLRDFLNEYNKNTQT